MGFAAGQARDASGGENADPTRSVGVPGGRGKRSGVRGEGWTEESPRGAWGYPGARRGTLAVVRNVWPIVVALVLGVAVGLAINALWTPGTWARMGVNDAAAFLSGNASAANQPSVAAHAAKFLADGTEFVGQLFVRALRVAAVPIVLFSVVLGVAGLGNPRHLGSVGVRTLVLYVVTTLIAAAMGLTIANVVRPGALVPAETSAGLLAQSPANMEGMIAAASQTRTFWQHLLAMVPTNPFDALARGDMLQVIVLAVVAGGLLVSLPTSRAKPVLDVTDALNEVTGKLVTLVMRAAPVAVFCLVAPVVAKMGASVLTALSAYVACVVGGLALVLGVVYGPLVWGLGRMAPTAFYKGMSPAMLVAFTTSSSNATLPVTMSCVTERLKVPARLAGFVLPIGATVNMNGTALYQGVAAVFIAQAMGVQLSVASQVSIVALATLSAVGTPGIPGGSLVFLVMVLQSVGVPAEGLALILGVDRLLDMSRTVVNVTGDAAVAVAVARMDRGASGEPRASEA